MAIFKCKMCGGSLEVAENQTVCECEYCGTNQTLPKSNNEQALNLINRANHFRQQCEFDKAAETYEKLIAQNDSDAELYWSLVLCRYGIEYVDDPLTKKKIATCHRTQFKSILDDADYLAAIERADMLQKPVFEEEAKYIDKVQKGILEISNKEEPFDVFICYKESDNNGRRTPDSVLAQDLYYQLTQEGFKVFFSRITLEDKLGTQYEPYIFAALNSARVMVVVGTKPEYFNAVWVRNEWSRYLMLMQEDRSRTIIPAYKDMDPYDLPDALSMFQAQDMSKLGFMQDLIRGISKIAKADEPKPQVVQQTVVQNVGGNASTEPLLKRVKLFLEDGDWNSANEYCNRVLDLDPECAQAYFYLFMAKVNAETEDKLKYLKAESGITGNDYYKKAYRFGDDSLKAKLDELNKQSIYNYAEEQYSNAKTDKDFGSVKSIYAKIQNFKDSAEKIKACEEKALEYLYTQTVNLMSAARDEIEFTKAAKLFENLKDYKDSAELIKQCRARIEEIEAEELAKEQERKRQEQLAEREAKRIAKRNKTIAIVSVAVVVLGITGGIVGNSIYKSSKYNNAVELFEAGKYEVAYQTFSELEDYKDTEEYLSNPKIIQFASVGDIVNFGDYSWYVISKTENNVQLLCEDMVCEKAYNEVYVDVTWETCTLRQWLNNDFYNEFSEEEKAYIAKTKLSNPDNAEYGTDGGNDTEDYIYLLSIDEAESLSEDIRAIGSWWWLRSPGYDLSRAAGVRSGGSLITGGAIVYDVSGAVRPALNLKF